MRVHLKHVFPVLAGGLALVATVAVVSRVRASAPVQHPSTHDTAPRAAVVLVERAPVANTLSVAGEFFPYQEVEIHAKVAGYIKKIPVDIGDRVHTGQTLAVLEIPELNAQVQGADASVRHSEQEITRARNEVARAQADHEALHAASDRLEKAAAARPGLVAQQEIDDSIAKDRASGAQVESAKAALAAAEQQLDVSRANRSQVSAVRDYSHITAPFDGVVTWRYADTGALVQAGTSNASAQPVVRLAQVRILRLRVPVPESLAAIIHQGSLADVTVQATKEQFTAKVARFTNALDRSTRTMQVEFDVPNAGHHLAPGMYADVVLQVQNKLNALTVPVQAVQRHNDEATVLVLDANNRIAVQPVELGIQEPSRVEVLSGLKEGDRVVVGDLSSYHAGEVVAPKPTRVADAQLSGSN